MECPQCGEVAPDGASWCEACGSDLQAEPAPACVSCGERDISEDGYCMSCGHKQPTERDHVVMAAGAAVAVSDRGLRHRHNEDAAAVGHLDDGTAVLVVCDGVSSTPGSAEASLGAAAAARDSLVSQLPAVEEAAEDLEASSLIEAMLVAVDAAQVEASAAPEVESDAPYSQGGPPSSTFVAAVARPDNDSDGEIEIAIAWLGDSRAYWVDSAAGGVATGVEPAAVQLTVDHELGGSLTRWLGADNGGAPADVSYHRATGPGHLLVCSDGLWRYAPSEAELATLVGRLESDHQTTEALAAALVDHAVASGGHDNVTVALWPSPGLGTPSVESEESNT